MVPACNYPLVTARKASAIQVFLVAVYVILPCQFEQGFQAVAQVFAALNADFAVVTIKLGIAITPGNDLRGMTGIIIAVGATNLAALGIKERFVDTTEQLDLGLCKRYTTGQNHADDG